MQYNLQIAFAAKLTLEFKEFQSANERFSLVTFSKEKVTPSSTLSGGFGTFSIKSTRKTPLDKTNVLYYNKANTCSEQKSRTQVPEMVKEEKTCITPWRNI